MPSIEVELSSAGVARVTMNRPEVFNAFDESVIEELDRAFRRLSADPQVRVAVLAGAGRHFSAGADLHWMQRASSATPEWNLEDARRFAAMLAGIANCPKPTVARIQGAALGGGVGLACACDVAICGAEATFCVSEAKFGILPAVIGPHLAGAIGRRQARRLALTAARIDATEALRIGLAHQVVAATELDAAVDATVAETLRCAPGAQAEIKRLFARFGAAEITDDVLELTARTISRVRATDEAREGFCAFFDKRDPGWIRK
jgi:methylglutaconyl-CoA hydratase